MSLSLPSASFTFTLHRQGRWPQRGQGSGGQAHGDWPRTGQGVFTHPHGFFPTVGLGGGEARKRFVQHADAPLLFGQRGDGNDLCPHIAISHRRIARAFLEAFHLLHVCLGKERVEDAAMVDSGLCAEDEIARAANLLVKMVGNDCDALQGRTNRGE